MQNGNTRPTKAFKVGAVRVAIWSNPRVSADGRSFNSHKTIIERTYKDKLNHFKTTGSLDVDDIPKAILALSHAYAFLVSHSSRQNGSHEDDATVGPNPGWSS